MAIVLPLLALPLVFAVCVSFARTQSAYAVIMRSAAAVVSVSAVWCVAANYGEIFSTGLSEYKFLRYAMLAVEAMIAGYIVYAGVKNRSYPVTVFSFAQIALITWLELFAGHDSREEASIFIDKLSLIMIAIVGIIGSLICVYAIEYMKDYRRRHPEYADRRPMFFTVLLVFVSAMFGLVIANDMTLLLFFWEITSLCSFLLIGYTKTPESIKNSFLALTVNVFGGLMFTIGIALLAVYEGVTDINGLLALDSNAPIVVAAVFFIAFAGLTKSAQLPFSEWLLGAMAAPTPTSAMLHSSTMVKAGVYLIIRLAPMLGRNAAGVSITLVGAVTFIVAAALAVSQSDSKKVLAYSTISNLGLIVACAGIDTGESLWAAVMLIIFHAIAKSLLFLTVGSTEYQLGSRDVEDMDGLFRISTSLTMLLVIGIAGMFVAPFGMLISKWAAMQAFVESGNIPVVLIIAFGSTVTLFFWTKWMGKLVANAHRFAPTSYVMRNDERVSLYTLAALVVVVCVTHPLISSAFIIPYIDGNLMTSFASPIDAQSSSVIILMLCMLFIIPIVLIPFYSKYRVKQTSTYMAGENAGDDIHFRGGMGRETMLELRNWYMPAFLRENRLIAAGCVCCAIIMLVGFFIAMGGVFL